MKQVTYRAPEPSDLHFITSSWLQSNRNSDFANYINNGDYYDYHDELIESILKRSMVTMIVDAEDLNHIYGYMVYENSDNDFVLHFIYIKFNYRNFGLAKNALLTIFPNFGNAECKLTHVDRVLTRIVEKKDMELGAGIKNYEIRKSSCFIKKREKYRLIYVPYELIKEMP